MALLCVLHLRSIQLPINSRVAADATYLVRVLLPALIHSLLMFLYCSILFSITVSVFPIIMFLVSFQCSSFAHSSHV